MTRLQNIPTCLHAHKHTPDLTIIFSCAPNKLLVISQMFALMIYSFCAEQFLEYVIHMDVREITKSMFFAKNSPVFVLFSKKSLRSFSLILQSNEKKCIKISQQFLSTSNIDQPRIINFGIDKELLPEYLKMVFCFVF